MLSKRFRRFVDRSDGGLSVEFVMWLPVMVAFLGFSADATMLFFQQQLMYDGVRDASRQVSLGQKNSSDAQTDLSSRFGGSEDNIEAKVVINNGYVTSNVTVPFNNVLIFGGVFAGDARLSATVTMWIEESGTSS